VTVKGARKELTLINDIQGKRVRCDFFRLDRVTCETTGKKDEKIKEEEKRKKKKKGETVLDYSTFIPGSRVRRV